MTNENTQTNAPDTKAAPVNPTSPQPMSEPKREPEQKPEQKTAPAPQPEKNEPARQ